MAARLEKSQAGRTSDRIMSGCFSLLIQKYRRNAEWRIYHFILFVILNARQLFGEPCYYRHFREIQNDVQRFWLSVNYDLHHAEYTIF